MAITDLLSQRDEELGLFERVMGGAAVFVRGSACLTSLVGGIMAGSWISPWTSGFLLELTLFGKALLVVSAALLGTILFVCSNVSK